VLKKQKLTEGTDYVINEDGYFELTAKFLLERGECCHNNCKNCPYPDCWCKIVREK